MGMDEIIPGSCWHMRGTREGLPRSLMEGTDGKKGLADAGAFTLPRAANLETGEATESSLGWLVPPVCCLPVHHSF